MVLSASLLLMLVAPVLPAHGLYFNVVEGVRKCFIEEVPEDVLVLGKYTSPDYSRLSLNTATGLPDPSNWSGIRATVTDPRNEVLLVHDTTKEGRFGFTSIVGGEHIVCLATNTSSWYGQARSFVSGTNRHTHAWASPREQRTAWSMSETHRVLLSSFVFVPVCSARNSLFSLTLERMRRTTARSPSRSTSAVRHNDTRQHRRYPASIDVDRT